MKKYENLKMKKVSIPAISIIIPSHNGAKYLNALVEKLNQQTFKDFEIVIINDKSTDNSKEIISSLKIKFKNIISKTLNYPKKYQHSYTHMNAILEGVNLASGKFFMVIDVDDQINNNEVLAKIAAYSQKNPTKNVIVTNFAYYKAGDKKPAMIWNNYKIYHTNNNLHLLSPAIWTKCINRQSFIDNNIIDKNNEVIWTHLYTDLYVHQKMAITYKKEEFGFLKLIAIRYMIHDSNTVVKKNLKSILEIYDVMKEIRKLPLKKEDMIYVHFRYFFVSTIFRLYLGGFKEEIKQVRATTGSYLGEKWYKNKKFKNLLTRKEKIILFFFQCHIYRPIINKIKNKFKISANKPKNKTNKK